MNLSICGDLAPSLGERKKFRRPRTILGKQFPFSRPKFLMTLFKVIDHDFRIFPISHIFAACNVVFDPFFTRKTPISKNNSFKTPFFTLFVLSHASDKHYFSKYWGDGCMGRHPISNFGGTVPQSPLGLRP